MYEIKISVRNLVEFIMRSGDLSVSSTGLKDANAMQEGTRIHKKLQRKAGAGYHAEVALSHTSEVTYDGLTFQITVEGRADGIYSDELGWNIDEIKGIYRDIHTLSEAIPVHRAQALCYGLIYALQNTLDGIGIRITYCHIPTEEVRYFHEFISFAELQNWYDTLLASYAKWASWQIRWQEERNNNIKSLEFPFSYRDGQNTLVKGVYQSILRKKRLYIEAPTGVGKTEVARQLAKELGIELVRFDMSEYTEKHTVAKLIGSPAGYVGYEDGGLLTDAIRKTPNCVLLLDEIEKAHSDIYNILLQVMDYARLTDNKGQKADFRNVILIMTSNAGAQYASRASVGFNGNVSRGDAMLAQVKKTFKPEFINRLSDMVVFNDMDKHMAELILAKKLRQLDAKLAAKGVTVTLTDAARGQLLKWGFTKEYGAREMDRVIGNRLKPILMKALLFGKLKKSGKAHVDFDGKELVINY